jgi:hypothetical protein
MAGRPKLDVGGHDKKVLVIESGTKDNAKGNCTNLDRPGRCAVLDVLLRNDWVLGLGSLATTDTSGCLSRIHSFLFMDKKMHHGFDWLGPLGARTSGTCGHCRHGRTAAVVARLSTRQTLIATGYIRIGTRVSRFQ